MKKFLNPLFLITPKTRASIARLLVPFISFMKWFQIVPRTWFPTYYYGNRVVLGKSSMRKYPTNHVSNTKYTIFTFAVHNLIEQFAMSHMNRYFLFVALVQLIPNISPVNPATTWIPMILVFSITAMFAMIDDIRRVISDKKINNRQITYINEDGQERKKSSKKIRVGNIIKVRENEEIPADLVVLHSSGKEGMVFITTANLDGEVDLKARPVPRRVYEFITGVQQRGGKDDSDDSEEDSDKDLTTDEDEPKPSSHTPSTTKWVRDFECTVECPQPNAEIYQFNSSMNVSGIEEPISLSADQLLLQSCMLKNTEWAIGVCVYNGNETKCGMNKRKVPSKRARSDYFMDKISLFVFGFQILIFLFFGGLANVFKYLSLPTGDSRGDEFYLGYQKYGEEEFCFWGICIPYLMWALDPLLMPVRFWLLCTYMIPISLKVTLDFMKFLYSLLIMYDRDMYDEDTNACANSRNQAIVEDLGQIEYVLSDKTGTLTQNVMEFQRCSILNTSYGSPQLPAMRDATLQNKVHKDTPEGTFFRALAICHTVSREEKNGKVAYQSVSPDEVALVKASCEAGVLLTQTEEEFTQIEIDAVKEKWNVIRVLKFTSDRKRMSVLSQRESTGEIVLWTKGADDVMLPRLMQDTKETIDSTKGFLNEYAKLGLRTLVVARKCLSAEVWDEFRQKLLEADNVVGAGRHAAVEQVYDELESDLELLGSTAIEDKLQEDVERTISMLRQAGIAVWMLTGDKFETAKQIGYSCQLVTRDTKLLEIVGCDSESIEESIQRASEYIKERGTGFPYSIIIEGSTLKIAFAEFAKDFKKLCLGAKTVVCARVTPGQKAEIVRLVKKEKKVTLSIGDGGNDVPMIQEAHVGVGITGKEGLQASRAADFSIGQFRFLIPLVFVHGHYSLSRSSMVIQYSFYKNIVLAFLQVMFNVLTRVSGESPYNDLSLSGYNTFFTIFVPVYILDRAINKRYLLRRPKLYSVSKNHWGYSILSFVLWFSVGILHALIVLFVVTISYSDNVTPQLTSTPSVQYFGIVCFSALSWVVDLTFLLLSNSFTFINTLFISAILLAYYIFLVFYNAALTIDFVPVLKWIGFLFGDDSEIFWVVFEQFRDPTMYFAVIFAVTNCLLLVLVFKFLKTKLLPNSIERFHLTDRKFRKYRVSTFLSLKKERELFKENDQSQEAKGFRKREEKLTKIGGGY